jgi:YggT family protein
MLTQAIVFLLQTFVGLFVLALLLRFYLQLMRAPARNPLSVFLAALTDWIVLPARRVIPGLWRIDITTLVLAWAVEVLLLATTFWLRGVDAGGMLGLGLLQLLLLGAVEIVKLSLYILMVSLIIQAVLSWVAPYSPVMPMLNSLTRPFLAPFQQRIQPVGNVDLSPLFLIVLCYLALFVVAWAEGAIVRGLG